MELTPQQAIDYAHCSDELPIMDPSVLARAAYPTYGRYPLGRNPSELVRAYESGEDRTALLREARYLRDLAGVHKGWNPYHHGETGLPRSLVERLFLSPEGDQVHEFGFWWEGGPITEALPAPFSLTRAHRRTVRGFHIVMRALLERRRAKLGKDALFVIFNLYRRMPDPMFRVILSFL